jgi:hypothetical protein
MDMPVERGNGQDVDKNEAKYEETKPCLAGI